MLSQTVTSYFYITVLAIAFFYSIRLVVSTQTLHLKIFSSLISLTFIVEFFAVIGIKFLRIRSNVAIYNVFMLVEFCTYAYYYHLVFKDRFLKSISLWFFYLFPIFWVIVVFFVFNGLSYWNSYIVVLGSFTTVFFSACYYYELFTAPTLVKLTKTPEFWIATGMILFYTCELPYMGMLNFLVKNYLWLAQKLLPVLTILDSIMYMFFTYAFICEITTKKSR